VLSIGGVSVCYDGAIVALEGIDLTVERGGLVALLGPNGAGKTTLLKAIAGMLPFEQGELTAGRISFAGTPLGRLHPARIARLGIALVQDGRQCFRGLTVEENLRAAGIAGGAGRARGARMERVFGYFPMLRELRARRAGFLSGGQLQMLVIAMALMSEPRLLLLDEPSLGLSPLMVQALFDQIERLHRELGTAMIVAEQAVPRLLTIATDVVVLASGRMAMHLPPAEVTEATLQRVYLG
jgi:branched-chain amino acid transport system ATP-binding protein